MAYIVQITLTIRAIETKGLVILLIDKIFSTLRFLVSLFWLSMNNDYIMTGPQYKW